MLFSDKKKKSNLNTLSEKEIQDKLYGRYRSNTGVASEPLPPLEQEMEPPVSRVRPKSVATEASDLFSGTGAPASREGLNTELPAFTPMKPKDGGEKAPQTGREDDKLGLDTMARFKKEVAFQKKKEETFLKRKPVTIQKKISIDWSLMWKAMGRACVAVFQWAGSILIVTLSKMNFRNPHFRRLLYWVGSVGLLLLLFWGIHFLNANREFAMKMAKKPVPVAERVADVEVETAATSPVEGQAAEIQDTKPGLREPETSVQAADTEVLTGYGVQVVTYVSQEDARGLVSRIKQAGFDAFVKMQQRSEGKFYYRVFLGPYEKYRRAQDELARFKKADISRPFQDAFVLSLERRAQTNG